MMTPRIRYGRAPSKELQGLLLQGELLAPLPTLTEQTVGGFRHDVHFRLNDEVHVYRGGTRLLDVQNRSGGCVNVTAEDEAYTSQSCAEELFKEWSTNKSDFCKALHAYLHSVEVRNRWIKGEGSVQMQWSRVRDPWVPFDREAVLKYEPAAYREKATQFPEVETARAELAAITREQGWAEPPSKGTELDHLAVDLEGRLVLIELKDAASTKPSGLYYAPFQLLQYVWEWHSALDAVLGDMQAVIDARVKVGLTPPDVCGLTGGIRAAIGFGRDVRTAGVRHRYDVVLRTVNRHLPPCVPEIETWGHTGDGPCRLA